MGSPKAPHLSWRDLSLDDCETRTRTSGLVSTRTRRIKMPTSSCILALEKMRGWLRLTRGNFTHRMDPVHSSSCGVLFRLCETLCVHTDQFAIPRTLVFHAHGRVPNLNFCENVLPPYHAKQERRCDLQKEEVSLSRQAECIAPPYVLPTSSLTSLPPLRRSQTWHFASNSVSSRVDYLSNHVLCLKITRVIERRSPKSRA